MWCPGRTKSREALTRQTLPLVVLAVLVLVLVLVLLLLYWVVPTSAGWTWPPCVVGVGVCACVGVDVGVGAGASVEAWGPPIRHYSLYLRQSTPFFTWRFGGRKEQWVTVVGVFVLQASTLSRASIRR